jgi:hypothetical protein
MDSYNEKQFTLTKKNPIKEFSFKYSFTTLLINRIILTSYPDQKNEEWTKVLNKIIINFKSIETETKRESSYVLPLIGELTPKHINPVFDVLIELPKENIGRTEALSSFFNKVLISLKEPDQFDDSLVLTFMYQTKPGLEE